MERQENNNQFRPRVVEIPEGKTSLIGDDCNFSYRGLYEYDVIDKLVFPSTLQLETVESEKYDPLLKWWYGVGHTRMYFSAYEDDGFMTAQHYRYKRVKIGEIENHSPHISIEDGVIYDADKSRLIFCNEEKTEFRVPDSVKIIESHAFCCQTKLMALALPQGLKEIHDGAFMGCSSLESIVIPEGVTVLPWNTFADCVSLREVKLPSGLKHIRPNAFRHCDTLVEIDLPESIESMDCFECCESLKRIAIPKGVTNVKGFAMCHSLEEIVLHGGVKEISSYAFRCCENLSKINFPEGLERIGARAFYPSRLSKAVFPATLKEIETEAFYYNTRLRYIKFKSVVELGQAVFARTPTLKRVRKPKGMQIRPDVWEQDKSLDKFAFWD